MVGELADSFTIQFARILHRIRVQLEREVVLEVIDHEPRLGHPVERRWSIERVLLLDKPTGLEVHLQVGPKIRMEHSAAPMAPALVNNGVPAAQEAADV